MSKEKVLIVIFIIALALRLFAVMNLPPRYKIPVSDAASYDTMALNLLAGKGFINSSTGLPTSFQMPGYSAFLAFVYLIFGHTYTAVRIIQCIMGALLCIIIYGIAKIAFDKKTALLSAAILAFYQPYLFYSFYGGPGFLLSENLFTFLTALFLFYLLKDSGSPGIKMGILSGILLGLATLTRPPLALFPLFLFCWLLYRMKFSVISAAKKILPLLAGFMLILSPWTLRNYYFHKAFVPFVTEGGLVLLAGNNHLAKGGTLTQPGIDSLLTEEDRSRLSNMSEVEKDRMYRRYAKDFLLKNYKKVPKLFFKKLLVFWDMYGVDYDSAGNIVGRPYNIWYSIVFIFALFGIGASIKSKPNIYALLLITLFFYFSVLAAISGGDPRYRYPIEPYLIIFAGSGIFAIYNAFRNKLLSFAVISTIIGINLLFYAYSDLVLNGARRLIGLLL